MKNCTGCKYANWRRTAAGRLHPSGIGKCVFPYKLPPLPAAMGWLFGSEPRIISGYTNRRVDLKDHCAYYTRVP